MEDYELLITELRDTMLSVMNDCARSGLRPRVSIWGHKAYGTFRQLFVIHHEASPPEFCELIMSIEGSHNREALRAILWQAFRRQPLYSLHGAQLPSISTATESVA